MKQVSSNPEVQTSFELFEKGYDAGMFEVLDALATFCEQGGVLNKNNIDKWINTYTLEEN